MLFIILRDSGSPELKRHQSTNKAYKCHNSSVEPRTLAMTFVCEYPYNDVHMGKAQLSDTDIATLENRVWLNCDVIGKYSFENALTLIILFTFQLFS